MPAGAEAFAPIVAKYCKQFNVPEDLVFSIMFIESTFKPGARSPTGAKGLMQLTGSAIADVNKNVFHIPANTKIDRGDIETNIKYGVAYLYILGTRIPDGPDKWKRVARRYNGGDDRHYVAKVFKYKDANFAPTADGPKTLASGAGGPEFDEAVTERRAAEKSRSQRSQAVVKDRI